MPGVCLVEKGKEVGHFSHIMGGGWVKGHRVRNGKAKCLGGKTLPTSKWGLRLKLRSRIGKSGGGDKY